MTKYTILDKGELINPNKYFKIGRIPRKDYSSFEFYACHKMRHISINFPHEKDQFKNNNWNYMPMQLKKINHMKRGLEKMKTLVKSMF